MTEKKIRYTLKGLRGNLNLTQQEAAEKIGVSRDTWANYEKAKYFPDVPIIEKIESAFNVSYDEIIFLPKNAVKPQIEDSDKQSYQMS